MRNIKRSKKEQLERLQLSDLPPNNRDRDESPTDLSKKNKKLLDKHRGSVSFKKQGTLRLPPTHSPHSKNASFNQPHSEQLDKKEQKSSPLKKPRKNESEYSPQLNQMDISLDNSESNSFAHKSIRASYIDKDFERCGPTLFHANSNPQDLRALIRDEMFS